MDFIVVNDDGNVLDAVMNSCIMALVDMRKPAVNIDKN
jgi:exosome complex RNA-binding protein Rrp42 (RNase PH superfamily)